jgi:hypothetical protein
MEHEFFFFFFLIKWGATNSVLGAGSDQFQSGPAEIIHPI